MVIIKYYKVVNDSTLGSSLIFFTLLTMVGEAFLYTRASVNDWVIRRLNVGPSARFVTEPWGQKRCIFPGVNLCLPPAPKVAFFIFLDIRQSCFPSVPSPAALLPPSTPLLSSPPLSPTHLSPSRIHFHLPYSHNRTSR